MRRQTPEGTVKAQIQDALRAMGCLVIRINAGVVRVKGGFMRGAPEGTADLLVFPGNGRMVALEIKQPGKKAAPEQLAWGAEWRRLGGTFAVVDTVDDAIRVVSVARSG
jgi:hypothetical protein